MRVIPLVVLLCALCQAAVAQTSECSTIPKASDRLACYDRAAPPMAALSERLHVRDADGAWLAGGRAVTRLAAEIPPLAPLGLVGSLPGLQLAVEAAYRVVADHRGTIGRWAWDHIFVRGFAAREHWARATDPRGASDHHPVHAAVVPLDVPGAP